MPRAGEPAPHCFTFQCGEALCKQYRDMLPGCVAETVAVYCCCKSFVRDSGQQQPPLLHLWPEQLLCLAGPWPDTILERRLLKDHGVQDAVKLSKLCLEKNQMMPRAADSLLAYSVEWTYSEPAWTWLQRPQRALLTLSLP